MRRTRAVAGAFSAIFFLLILGPAGAAPGDLDLGFADDGIAQVQIGSGSQATGVVLQPDGKVVLGGWTSDSHTALARYLPDGRLDSAFGSGGIVVGPSGQTYSMALQPDGKILLAGWGANGNFGFFLVRFLPDGSLDMSFGSHGIASGPRGYALGIALQPDGYIVLAGSDNGAGFLLARFDPAGALDPGFGTNGVVRTRIGQGRSGANAVVVQPDGKIVAAGESGIPDPPYSVIALARYLPDGSLDPAFGSGGTVTAAVGSRSVSTSSLALQTNGRLIAAGTFDDQFGVVRFLPDGSLDTAFAAHGVATTPVGSYADAHALALQPDGRIVVAGWAFGNFALVRYEPDGTLDASFGEGGVTQTAVGSYGSGWYALALQPDGRILAAGSSSGSPGSQFALARYLVTTPSTITAAPLIVDYGQRVQLSGVLTTRQPGSVSVLERDCFDSSTSTAATTTAGADGSWAASVAPGERTEYRAGVGLERSAGLTVWVRPRLTLTRASAGSLRARALFGHSLAGESVVLQRYAKRKGGRWLDHRSLPMRRVEDRGSEFVSGAKFRVQRRPGRRLRIVLRHDGLDDCFESAVSPAIRG